jgi:hypothetical protein
MDSALARGVGIVLLAMASCASVVPRAHAQDKPKPAAAEREDVVITRVYDIRDLTRQIPDYPFLGSVVGSIPRVAETRPPEGGGGLFGDQKPAAAKRTPETMATEVMNLVKETVEPESWRDAGGTVGAIRVVDGVLVVTQTQSAQQMIASLFEQFRETKARIVRIRARWITLDDAQLARIQGGPSTRPASVFPAVDVAGLLKESPDAVKYRGEIACYNWQTVHLVAGHVRSAVTDLSPVVGQGAIGYDATVEFVRSGAMLQVTPMVQPDGTVALDLHSLVNELDEPSGLIDLKKLTPATAGVIAERCIAIHAREDQQVADGQQYFTAATLVRRLDQVERLQRLTVMLQCRLPGQLLRRTVSSQHRVGDRLGQVVADRRLAEVVR